MSKRLPCLMATILLASGVVISTGSADAATGRRIVVFGFGTTSVVSTPFLFEGSAWVHFNRPWRNADVTTALLGPPIANPDGTLEAMTSHTFVFGNGDSFTTLDNATLTPTDTPGTFQLSSDLEVTSGTGAFGRAHGHLHLHGKISLTTDPLLFGPSARWMVYGVLRNRR